MQLPDSPKLCDFLDPRVELGRDQGTPGAPILVRHHASRGGMLRSPAFQANFVRKVRQSAAFHIRAVVRC